MKNYPVALLVNEIIDHESRVMSSVLAVLIQAASPDEARGKGYELIHRLFPENRKRMHYYVDVGNPDDPITDIGKVSLVKKP